ncbi:XRE family transcriptional regulator [Saccharothrix obliqua]|uniref:XRE family transcriptional regulator n=1 Tax=Saccharothrix obliqua TaxID=2861747 RepID=UPI001C5E28A3|nr:XRE family transcriptional regulator [Saccharothrix obliqua]MBW4717778.1 XRE family transcriptional regulator [Saccharothrix obliqua]
MDTARTDTFAGALRAAIAERGLGLERIREHLAQHGVRVSLATLSYWQSGRSRPERRSSLAAIGHLEEILALPDGYLASLLGPPRPRGRWLKRVPEQPPPAGPEWSEPDQAAWALRQADTGRDHPLTRLSQHDLVTIGPDRGERTVRSRHVLRAEADGADRWVVVVRVDEPGRALPLLRPLRHCAVGRLVSRPGTGLVVAELLFDRALRRGDSIVVEHELVHRPPYPPATDCGRTFRVPVREYVLEVAFDPLARPVECELYRTPAGGHPDVRPAEVDTGGALLGVALDFGPGDYGFRWKWPNAHRLG